MTSPAKRVIPVARREVMYAYYEDPLETPIGGAVCWVQREEDDDAFEVLKLVVADLRFTGYLDDENAVALSAKPVLMRTESDVEAKINGREDENCYVECTKRARRPELFWRVERSA